LRSFQPDIPIKARLGCVYGFLFVLVIFGFLLFHDDLLELLLAHDEGYGVGAFGHGVDLVHAHGWLVILDVEFETSVEEGWLLADHTKALTQVVDVVVFYVYAVD
jgi:hypothetical protein